MHEGLVKKFVIPSRDDDLLEESDDFYTISIRPQLDEIISKVFRKFSCTFLSSYEFCCPGFSGSTDPSLCLFLFCFVSPLVSTKCATLFLPKRPEYPFPRRYDVGTCHC